ncbi:MAG: hypothetical protein ACE5EL_07750 [Anaerolineae bacterium]
MRPSVGGAVLAGAMCLALWGLGGPEPVHTAGRLSPEVPSGWALLDGFEDPNWPDPGLWPVAPEKPPTWWPSTCHAKDGTHGLWAFGGRTARGEVPCGSPVPAGTSSSAVMRLDLTAATKASRLDLFFDLWLGLPPAVTGSAPGALYVNLLVPEAGGARRRVTVFGATGRSGSWSYPPRRLDLMALTDISNPDRVYDLRGGEWFLEWLAVAPNGANAGTGAFIDNLALVWEPDPAVPTPTQRPSPAPKATASPGPTASPSPTSTAMAAGKALLPAALVSYDLRPPAPASPSPGATAGPSPTQAPPTASPRAGPPARGVGTGVSGR